MLEKMSCNESSSNNTTSIESTSTEITSCSINTSSSNIDCTNSSNETSTSTSKELIFQSIEMLKNNGKFIRPIKKSKEVKKQLRQSLLTKH